MGGGMKEGRVGYLCKREREREKKGERERERERDTPLDANEVNFDF
jgi:hypothetical protein